MNEKQNKLEAEPVGKLLFSLAAPAILSQVINLLYNVVDRIYIGHIPEVGKMALTGVGVCLPLITLTMAFAALVSMGGAPRASIFMGKGDSATAEKILGNCTTMLISVAIALTILFQVFSERLLLMFGASENTLSYAVDYMKIYSLGTIFVQLTLGLNAFVSAQGFAKISMYTVLIGAICNIILDPIFIFLFHMGVKGGALATIISQAISMIWILRFLTSGKTALRLRRQNMLLTPEIILPSVGLGLAPFIMQSTESLLTICFNSSLLKYGGDVAVGAMTILASISQLGNMPIAGLAQGAQPIISFNYGAGNKERVKKAFGLLFAIGVSFSMIVWLLELAFPSVFIMIFNNDPELVAFASRALRIYLAVNGLMGIQMVCQQTFVSIGNMKASIFVACLRKIILLIPLIYILPLFLEDKTAAVFLAEPLADIVSVTTVSILFTIQFRKALREM